ncbi:hypothetical protein R1sor_004175 [Riccia sorocarpa]|uniref:Uncharacterized protein n=1 Tax=Riccia sorocarpa TaxID=122646 RepID=A0ABD3H4F5_9MARC
MVDVVIQVTIQVSQDQIESLGRNFSHPLAHWVKFSSEEFGVPCKFVGPCIKFSRIFATAVRFMAKGRKKVDKPIGMNVGLEGETWLGKLRGSGCV